MRKAEPGRAAAERQYEDQLRQVNEELLVSSVRQHELTEQAELAAAEAVQANVQAELALERIRQTEAALRTSEEQFRRAVEDAPVPVIMHAEDGEVLQISGAWTALTGYTLEDKSVIQSWLTTAYGFGGDKVRDAMQNAFMPPRYGDGPMKSVTFDIVTRSGETRKWSFSASTPGVLSDGRRFVVGTAEDITDRVRSEQALREKQTELAESQLRLAVELAAAQQLQNVSTELIAEDDPSALYEKILDAGVAIMRAQFATIHLFHPERGKAGELELLAHRGFSQGAATYWEWMDQRSESACATALRTGRRVIVPNVEADGTLTRTEAQSMYLQSGIHAVQSTPLLSRSNKVLGVLSTHWSHSHKPTERDLRLLDVLARQAADLMERAEAERDLRASERRQVFLLGLSDSIRGLSDPVEIQSTAMHSLGSYLGVNRAYYSCMMSDDETLVTGPGYFKQVVSLPERMRISDLHESLRTALYAGHTVVINDVLADRSIDDRHQKAFAAIQTRAGVGVPLLKDDRFVAVMGVHQSEPRVWSVAEISLVEEVAERTWAAVERAHAEESLRESEARRRLALDAADMGTFMWHIEEDRGEPDERMLALFGLPPNASLSLTEALATLIHPDDRSYYADAVARATNPSGDGRLRAEIRVVHSDGSTHWLVITAQAVFEGNPRRAVRMSGIAADISERKYTQEALRESEEQMRLLIESATEYAIFTLDEGNRITSWNSGAEKVFGWKEPEILGRSGGILFTPEDRKSGVVEREMEAAVRAGYAEDERSHIRKDGSWFYASGTMHPVFDSGNRLVGYVKIARDMTSKVEADEAKSQKKTLQTIIVAQEDERRRIAQDLHDHLGQQLTGLRLRIAGLKIVSEHDAAFLKKVDATQDLAAEIDKDLDYLTWEMRPRVLDDIGLVPALANLVREWSKQFGITADLKTDQRGKVRLARDAETQLYRISQEALNNVYKHARATHVQVVFERRDRHAFLQIKDNGIGAIAKPESPDSGDSMRLGLSGMRERAALAGGTIEIESTPGKGTTISVSVPYFDHPGLGNEKII